MENLKGIQKVFCNGSHFNVMSKSEVNRNCNNIIQIIPVAFNEYLVEVHDDSNPIKVEGELVHCKDCKHLFDGTHNANCCEVLMRKAKWVIEITVDLDWYCAEGKRKKDDTP